MSARLPQSLVDMLIPACAVCGKQVERMERLDDHAHGSMVLTVYCHGESETMELYEEVAMLARNIEPGVAFAAKSLPPPPKILPPQESP